MLILGLQGSPRKGGNTDGLLAALLARAEEAGARTRTIQVARAGIAACKGCGYCERHGSCVITDDPMADEIYGLMRRADLIVAASPVFFYGVSAQLKGLIDRSQTLWSRKYIYKLKDPLADTRQGILLSVAASHGQQLFDGVHLTVNYFFDAIDARPVHALTYRGVESKGDIFKQERLADDIEAIVDTYVRPVVARKRVLFVSQAGACRGPLAAALTQRRHGQWLRADCAALKPAEGFSTPMVGRLERVGVDMAYRRPASIEQTLVSTVPDLVVIVDHAIDQNPLPGAKSVRWPLAVPEPTEEALDRLFVDTESHIDRITDWLGQP